ncbi:hypothetical protein ACRALDRAFT_1059425, partial [Sodiomyces alcalophilus JCM 7366]|uniref:uncharacterized protein n=1 Tax=Sodiomyces alcalophilus JCM 7366 TaxID=591952 RepID=UPI0039B68076
MERAFENERQANQVVNYLPATCQTSVAEWYVPHTQHLPSIGLLEERLPNFKGFKSAEHLQVIEEGNSTPWNYVVLVVAALGYFL